MKLTKELLKEMIIKEMNSLNPKHEPKYDRILRILRDGTYRSVAIMSGQFPMGEKPDPRLADVERVANANRKRRLEERLKELGLKFIRIGGKFGPNIEQAVLIFNPNQEPTPGAHWNFLHTIAGLNREFRQWGFVGGERISDPNNPSMGFTLFEIDYSFDDPKAYKSLGPYLTTTTVYDDSQMANKTTDYSFDPTSGQKFGIPLEE